jgi:two-component system, NarL family, response regulator NreC
VLVRILIADDHEIVRKGVATVLSVRPDLEICGEAADGEEAVRKAEELRPDLVILDLTMPGLNGISAAEKIRKILPGVPILILSMHEGASLLETFRHIGVQGYVPKTQASEKLLDAVDALANGNTYFS